MIILPVQSYINQEFSILLDGQNCVIALYQRGERMYLDLSVGGEWVRRGAVCLPKTSILGDQAKFSGALRVMDTLSTPERQAPPQWEALGERWKFVYLSAEEVAAHG